MSIETQVLRDRIIELESAIRAHEIAMDGTTMAGKVLDENKKLWRVLAIPNDPAPIDLPMFMQQCAAYWVIRQKPRSTGTINPPQLRSDLNALRIKRGMSYDDLSVATRVPKSGLSKFLHGRELSARNLMKIEEWVNKQIGSL